MIDLLLFIKANYQLAMFLLTALSIYVSFHFQKKDGKKTQFDLFVDLNKNIENTSKDLKKELGKDFDKKIDSLEEKIDTRFTTSEEKINTKVDNLEGNINTKIDNLEGKINTKIDNLEGKINTKVDNLEGKINTKIDNLEGKINTKIENLEGKINTKIENLEEKIDTRFTTSEEKITTKIETSSKELSKEISSVSEKNAGNTSKINNIEGWMQKLDGPKLQHHAVQSNSPKVLTYFGDKLADQLKAKQTVLKHAERWLQTLNISPDADKLMIQEVCFAFCADKLWEKVSSDEAKSIREMMFQYSANYGNTTDIYAIFLRDLVFEQRGIPVPKRQELIDE